MKTNVLKFEPVMGTDAKGEPIQISIPVTQREVMDRVNKAIGPERQRLLADEGRVVWVDMRALTVREIDLEDYARRHGQMDPAEKLTGA